MKETNLYKIRDQALKSGRAVFSIQQLANLICKPKAVATVYSLRLVKKGLAKRLLRGKITFVEDDYVIASQLFEPSYVSLASALLFHGLITQIPSKVECATPKNSKTFAGLGISYHKIPPSLFLGFARHAKGESYVLVADAEKAAIDMVYLNMMPKSLLSDIAGKLDRNKMEEYVRRFRGRGAKKLRRLLL